ncbi:hypothetical protein Cde04nite_21670 [Cellulomonas denverensis]|nr:hypothetical protein Cde04nite_21670 [Cellulomonas denverensis]
MTTRSPLRRRLAAVALSCAMVFAVPALASADEGDGDVAITPYAAGQCTAARFCIWSNPGYSGVFWSTGTAGVQSTNMTTAKTIWNRTGVAVRMYAVTGGTGNWTCVNAGTLFTSTDLPVRSIRTMTTAIC